MGAGSVSGITQAEQADAAREAAKHAAAFHPVEYYGVNPASLGNVPLSQIASRYGTGFADIVQGYYTQNPTSEARAITAQYNAQHAIAENPFNTESAAGIAWEVARTTGGAGNITESMKKTAGIESRASYGVDIFQGMSAVKGVSTVPTRLTGSGMIAGMPSTAQYITPGEDVYMAIGGYQGVRVPGAKVAIDYATGEFGVYAPRTPGSSAYSLIGGGGRYSAQSGMFSIGTSLWDKEHTFEQSQIGGMQPVSEEYMATHSKAGAEAYGGISRALNGNLLTPSEQISRYYGEGSSNLANFAAQIAGGKSEAPGAKIPWGISASSPTMQYMNETGIVSGDVRSATGQTIGEILGSKNEGRLVGSKVIAGSQTYGTTEAGAAGLPSPYISASTGVIAPTGEVSIDFFGNKATLLPAGIPVISDVVKFFQPQQQVTTTMVGETTLPTETRLVKTEYTPLKESVSFLGTTQKEIPEGIETTKYYEKTGGMEALSTYETTGGKQREFATVVAPIPKSSGLDIFEQKIRETPGLPSAAKGEAIVAGLQKFTLPQYTAAPELAVATAERVLPSLFGEATAKETINATKEFGLTETIYAMAPGSLKGQYEMFHEHPTMSAISYAAGGVVGTVAKTGEGLYMAGRAGLAERAISQGGVWRAAEQVTGTVMSRAPQALAAMYSVDIAGRATEGFTNLSPATAIPKARAIVTQEAYPMMLGFEAPGQVVAAAKTAQQGYRQAQLEIATERTELLQKPVSQADVGMRDVAKYVISPKISAAKYQVGEAATEFVGTVGGRIGGTTVERGLSFETKHADYLATAREGAYGVAKGVSQGVARAGESATSFYGKVKAPYETVRGEYYSYLTETTPALTPRQKIDTALLEMQKKTGILRPEELSVFDPATGKLIYSTRGPLYDPATREWMSSVNIEGKALQPAMRKVGIEPLTTKQIGGKTVEANDYSSVEIYHTHPRGTSITGTVEGLEIPSYSDLYSASKWKTAQEGIVTPTGVMTYQPSFLPRAEVYTRSQTMAGVAYSMTGSEEAVGKVFAESMSRYGSAGKAGFKYRTTAEIQAGLPRETGMQQNIWGFVHSKFYPKYFEAKTAATVLPERVAVGVAKGVASARVTAMDIADMPAQMVATSRRTPITPEISRPAYPEYSTTGVYEKTSPAQKVESFMEWVYEPRLAKVIAPSTFGETKPIGGFITTTVGGATPEAAGKPAGKPPASGAFRKTQYGTGLAKEQSLKSMGVSERAAPVGKSTLRGEQVTDFRGKPVSERMKPMERGTYGPQGAQAAGQPRLLMEELPKVEGMTQGRVSPQEMRFVSGAPSLQQSGRTGVVQVTEPSLAFTQERRQQQFARVIPVVSVTPAAMVSSAVESRTWQGVSQAARQAQITSVIPSFGQTTEARTTQASRQASTRDYTRDLITTPIIRTGLITSFTPFQTTDTRTTQTTKTSQITETKPYKDTWTKPWGETFIERGGGGGAWPGGASGATPGRRPRRAAFMETFMMGLDVGFGMGGRRPRAKSFTTPKKYKTKPAAKKKAGKK